MKIDILVSQRYSAASNCKRQVEVRCNWNFFQTEPGSVGSTKPVRLITKWSCSNSPLETPFRNLGTILLLYFKYCQSYLNTSASNRNHKNTKKKKKKNMERNETHAIKSNK